MHIMPCCEFTYEQYINENDSVDYEIYNKLKDENLVDKHRACQSHCCILHGCKYDHKDCPVCLGVVRQKFLCDYCGDICYVDESTVDKLWSKIDSLFIKENRKFKLKDIEKVDLLNHIIFNQKN